MNRRIRVRTYGGVRGVELIVPLYSIESSGTGVFIPTVELIENNPELEMVPLEADAMSYIQDGAIGGHGVSLHPFDFDWDWERDGLWLGDIELESFDDYVIATLENISMYGHNFVMKVFVNYEETPFRVQGGEDFTETFLFSIESGYEAKIPFVLDLEDPEGDATYKLTVAIFGDPERHMIDGDAHWNFDDYTTNFGSIVERYLVFGAGGEVILGEYNTEPLASRENKFFTTIQVNTDLDVEDFYTRESSYPPVRSIQVRAGEEIELAWFVNTVIEIRNDELVTADDYVVVGLLDWEQIPLNDKTYFYVDASDHDFEQRVDFGHLTIKALNEVGKYDFMAFLAPNPKHLTELLYPLESTVRITIEVVE